MIYPTILTCMNDNSFRVAELLGAIEAPTSPEHASGAVRSTNVALNALLIAKKPSKEGSKRNNYYHYDVVIDGEVIVSDAWEPCLEACRVLRNSGITGSITFLDGNPKASAHHS